jgi:ArsR family transcriptional regulator, arsenate/arsenite/antimonite-responsive transcriptional repressor
MEATKAFRILSDETRLRILNLVSERECCVCEVVQALEISQSKASRGLTGLCDAGFLKLRKDGLWSLYSLDKDMKENLADLVSATRKSLAGNRVAELDRERLKTARRTSKSPAVPCATALPSHQQ